MVMKQDDSVEPVHLIKSTIEEHSLLPDEGGLVIVGYSGGGDSTAMLHALSRLQDTFPIRLHAAHLHHGMRSEADADAEACATFAESLNISITIERVDVPALAKQQKVSIEEAGRKARYDFFDRLALKTGACRIATAHTRDDRVETILINLLRGTGTRGLRGIPYQRGNIIRPLLNISREQTRAYCQFHQLPVLFDATNLDPRQLRGRVRRELLPLMKNLSPGVEAALLRMADIIRLEEDYWEQTMQSLMRNSLFAKPNVVQLARLRDYHPAVQRRFLRELVKRYLPPGEAPNFEIIARMQNDIEEYRTSNWTFNKGVHIHIHPSLLAVTQESEEPPPQSYEYTLVVGEPLVIPEANASILVDEASCPDEYHPASPYEAYLAAEAIQGRLHVRNKRAGDRFEPLGLNGSRLVSDIINDKKWDKRWRVVCPLLCDESGILWVPGYTIADRVKITVSTKRFLRVTLARETEV